MLCTRANRQRKIKTMLSRSAGENNKRFGTMWFYCGHRESWWLWRKNQRFWAPAFVRSLSWFPSSPKKHTTQRQKSLTFLVLSRWIWTSQPISFHSFSISRTSFSSPWRKYSSGKSTLLRIKTTPFGLLDMLQTWNNSKQQHTSSKRESKHITDVIRQTNLFQRINQVDTGNIVRQAENRKLFAAERLNSLHVFHMTALFSTLTTNTICFLQEKRGNVCCTSRQVFNSAYFTIHDRKQGYTVFIPFLAALDRKPNGMVLKY